MEVKGPRMIVKGPTYRCKRATHAEASR